MSNPSIFDNTLILIQGEVMEALKWSSGRYGDAITLVNTNQTSTFSTADGVIPPAPRTSPLHCCSCMLDVDANNTHVLFLYVLFMFYVFIHVLFTISMVRPRFE